MPAWPTRPRPGLFPPDGPRAAPAPAPAALVATTVEKHRGRLERRTLESTSILTAGGQWAGRRQGFRVRRAVTYRGKTTVETVHGITSLTPEQADAARLLQAVREHWQVENGVHYVRDVTLGEDACRVRKGTAPQVLAALRNLVVFVVSAVASLDGSTDSRPDVIRRCAAQPAYATQLLDLPPLD